MNDIIPDYEADYENVVHLNSRRVSVTHAEFDPIIRTQAILCATLLNLTAQYLNEQGDVELAARFMLVSEVAGKLAPLIGQS